MGKKYRERVEREKNAGWKVRLQRSWLWKIFLFSFKSLSVLAFLCYLMLGSAMTYGWIKTKWYRHYPTEYAGQLCQKYALGRDPKPDKIIDWLTSRKVSEADLIMEKLEACTPHLSSITFLAFSNWKFQQGKKLEALNWRQYARFRARFDALRCGSNDAGDNLNEIIDISAREEFQQMMARDPSLQPKSIVWALEYDAKFPPPQNNPAALCKQLNSMENGRFTMVPRSEWGSIHRTLRDISYYFVELMEADIKRGGRGMIEMPSMKIPDEDMEPSAPEQNGQEKEEKFNEKQDDNGKKEE